MKLIFTKEALLQIKDMVYATETAGVSLFGEKEGEDFRVLKVAVSKATSTESFTADISEQNSHARHIGDFHVHQKGKHRLSEAELENVREVLETSQEFVAGVILRYDGTVNFYPVYFSPRRPQGQRMDLQYIGTFHTSASFTPAQQIPYSCSRVMVWRKQGVQYARQTWRWEMK